MRIKSFALIFFQQRKCIGERIGHIKKWTFRKSEKWRDNFKPSRAWKWYRVDKTDSTKR